MNRTEAIKAMLDGEKVTNSLICGNKSYCEYNINYPIPFRLVGIESEVLEGIWDSSDWWLWKPVKEYEYKWVIEFEDKTDLSNCYYKTIEDARRNFVFSEVIIQADWTKREVNPWQQ